MFWSDTKLPTDHSCAVRMPGARPILIIIHSTGHNGYLWILCMQNIHYPLTGGFLWLSSSGELKLQWLTFKLYACWDLDCNISTAASCQINWAWCIPGLHATFAPKQAWHLLLPGARGGGCKVLIPDEGTIMFDSLLWWQERLPRASNASKLSLKLAVSTTQTSTMIDGLYLISS